MEVKGLKSIVKIKNPALRHLAGFGVVVLAGAILIGICYIVGHFVTIPLFQTVYQTAYPGLSPYFFFDPGFLLTVISGFVLLAAIFAVIFTAVLIRDAAKSLGEKLFDP